ncbi:hypothetical protein MASR2M15_19390 [Anaerolineales bacterium]
MSKKFTISTFYKFVNLSDYKALQAPLQETCDHLHIRGSILLSSEGINATISGEDAAVKQFIDYLKADKRFEDLEQKLSYADFIPFERMRVRLKKEIVTFKQLDVSPNAIVGEYVPPSEWNHLISDPEVILIDARNHYETKLGTFRNAIDPMTDSFSDFSEYVQRNLEDKKDKKIAMFCTGGIRCEKATSYLMQQGFENVYHLKGGILNYLETVPVTHSLWEGECFVFDERITLTHDLEPGHAEYCPHCYEHFIDHCDNCGK